MLVIGVLQPLLLDEGGVLDQPELGRRDGAANPGGTPGRVAPRGLSGRRFAWARIAWPECMRGLVFLTCS